MIAEIAADLVAKVSSVMGTRTGLSLGGRKNDPALEKLTLPGAWVFLRGDQVDEQDYTHGPSSGVISPSQPMMAIWAVTAFVPYVDDNDLLAVQYPLLEALVNAVQGTRCEAAGYNWRFIKRQVALLSPDRIGYEHLFTLTYITNS